MTNDELEAAIARLQSVKGSSFTSRGRAAHQLRQRRITHLQAILDNRRAQAALATGSTTVNTIAPTHGGTRFVRVFCRGMRPFWLEVTSDDGQWLVGFEVDRNGDRIAPLGANSDRLRRVQQAAISRVEEWRENYTYASLDRVPALEVQS